MIKKAVCQVCSELEHKYRCPQCRIVYCSLSCYKTHKENCVPKDQVEEIESTESEKSLPTATIEQVPDFELDDEESVDKVSLEKLQALEGSEELQNMLCNPHLRQMMTSLVRASNPGSQLEKAMQEPIFTEFADKCLSIVDNKVNS